MAFDVLRAVTCSLSVSCYLSFSLYFCASIQASLEKRVETVNEFDIEVFGIQRVIKPVSNNPIKWHSYYSAEGSLLFTLLSFFSCTYAHLSCKLCVKVTAFLLRYFGLFTLFKINVTKGG